MQYSFSILADPQALPKTGNNLCELTECRFYSQCVVINGSAECVCDKGCTKELAPKCGSDNITYDNLCELKRASCEKMRDINVVNDGECGRININSPSSSLITLQNPVSSLQR